MVDHLSTEQRSWNMSRIRSKDTTPEKTVRSLLHNMGYRFRIHRSDLPGKPDIVLKKHNLIIFCHGCFWHQHPNCKRATIPKTNKQYWIPKLERNVARFYEVKKQLKKMGWKVAVVWECEIKEFDKLVKKLKRLFEGINMKFKLGELFCGPGGLALGAKYAKVRANGEVYSIEHAWATDYDNDTCETFRNNICPNNPQSVVCRDIRKLNFKTLEKISKIDALAFGFPCNDFSVVGEQKGMNGVYGPLYNYCVKALKHFQPKWFFAENVGGLKNSNEGNALNIILNEFAEANYSLYPHLYKFELYGVPQARHRIIIIGIRNDIDVVFKIPSPEPYLGKNISCRNAIINPPIKPDTPNHEFTKQSKAVVERLKYIKPGENAFTANIPEHLRLKVKGAKISVIYKRLDPDKPAYTITGSGGGGTHVYHWSENRALTNRERARLQTFPDDFIFSGSKESVRKQIGMAVPPSGAKIIFESVLKSFAGIAYPSTEANLKPVFLEKKQFTVGVAV